jgi:hypothetical protein
LADTVAERIFFYLSLQKEQKIPITAHSKPADNTMNRKNRLSEEGEYVLHFAKMNLSDQGQHMVAGVCGENISDAMQQLNTAIEGYTKEMIAKLRSSNRWQQARIFRDYQEKIRRVRLQSNIRELVAHVVAESGIEMD